MNSTRGKLKNCKHSFSNNKSQSMNWNANSDKKMKRPTLERIQLIFKHKPKNFSPEKHQLKSPASTSKLYIAHL